MVYYKGQVVKDVCILVPTLGRPHHIKPLLDSIYKNTTNFSILFLTSPSDYDVEAKITECDEKFIEVATREKGDYARKINVGYKETEEPLLFLAATDLFFHEHWLDRATDKLSDKIHVVGTNDMGNGRVTSGKHSTHSLVTREYVDRFGVIDEPGKVLHEGYPHEYVDDEFVQTAQHRQAFAMALDSYVEHLHPAWGKAEWDASYLEVNQRLIGGKRLYRRRKRMWT